MTEKQDEKGLDKKSKEGTFNLSEKSWKVCSDPSNPKYDLDVIDIKDVKEFIRRLKELIENNDESLYGVFLIQEIDKLAGDDLR